MGENFPNLMKTINLLIQKTHEPLSKGNKKKTIPRHIIIKLFTDSDKEKILKAPRGGKNTLYTEKQRMKTVFSWETM